MLSRFSGAVAVALLASLAGGAAAHAQETSDDIPTAVSPPSIPTEVAVGVYLIGLSQVSEPSDPFPTVDLEVFINVSWHDPRLAFEDTGGSPIVFQEEEAEEKLSEIWSPDIEIQNEVQQRATESVQLTIFPDGMVDYEERFGATLNAELDLHEFPFDRQALDMELQAFVWDRTEMLLVANEAQTGFDDGFLTPEWSVTGVETLIGSRSDVRDDREFSTFTFRIRAQRHAGHYLLRFVLPLFFVMTMTWLAFWEPPENRYRIGFLALLTVVATHAIVSGSIPRLDYPTLADMILIVCYLAATALVAVSIVVQRIEARGFPERARTFDRWARWSLPVAAAVVLAVSALILWN
jgi:hypothetical protein